MVVRRLVKKRRCRTLKEAANALYHVYDVCPPGINCGSYESSYIKILDLMDELRCPKKRGR